MRFCRVSLLNETLERPFGGSSTCKSLGCECVTCSSLVASGRKPGDLGVALPMQSQKKLFPDDGIWSRIIFACKAK